MTYLRPMGDADPWDGSPPTVFDAFGNVLVAIVGSVKDLVSGAPTGPSGENITATSGGGPSIDGSDFTSSGGICKPTNTIALNYVKDLQRQMNRVASKKGLGVVGVDGTIGPMTAALFAKIAAMSGGMLSGSDDASCMGVAANADVFASQMQAFADSIGAPSTAPSAPTKTSTIVTKAGNRVEVHDSVGDAWSKLGTIEKVALVGVAGGIGYLLYTGKKRRKGKR